MKYFLVFLLYPIISFSQTGNLFKLNNKKDAFGDIVGQNFTAIATGTFSNNAVVNGKLLVKAVYEPSKIETKEEWKKRYMEMSFIKEMTPKKRKKYFKEYEEQYYEEDNSDLGSLKFYFFEYGKHIKNFSDFVLIRAKFSQNEKYSFGQKMSGKRAFIFRYKDGSSRDKSNYSSIVDYSNSKKIYDKTIKSNKKVDFVISDGNSTYKFSLIPSKD